jgi:hypothetical protein
MTKTQNQFNISIHDSQNDRAYFAVSYNGYSAPLSNIGKLRCVQRI